jgi:bifunctional enzyme CysN/CysC
VFWQGMAVDRSARAALKNQKPFVLWFTGLSASGKSTIANGLEKLLHLNGRHTYLLDGDNVRNGLNRDLGFSINDRNENIRRIAEVANLMAEAGLIVLVSVISPLRSQREAARDVVQSAEFIEIFVDTPLEECIRRDPKGLYKLALAGKIRDFTGLESPYERPNSPQIRLLTTETTPDALAERLLKSLEERWK